MKVNEVLPTEGLISPCRVGEDAAGVKCSIVGLRYHGRSVAQTIAYVEGRDAEVTRRRIVATLHLSRELGDLKREWKG